MSADKTLRLGLIGGNITQSRSPALQIVCGLSVTRNVSYDLLIPSEQGLSFEAMLDRCKAVGFDGVNVTYPYKELVLKRIPAGDPVLVALGAANTVRFSASGDLAYNSDYTGFIAAFRQRWGERQPGRVLIIGTGGVGRAIAFALAQLGAKEILLHDLDAEKSRSLKRDIAAHSDVKSTLFNLGTASNLDGIDGVVNGTPLGMNGKPGSPLAASHSGKPAWAFDAVYTPEHTQFRSQCEALGAEFLSGYELYVHQGIHAFQIFTGGLKADESWVRSTLKGKPVI